MKLYAALGFVLVAAVVGFTLWSNQGSRLILQGSIQKVRLQSVDESNTVAVVEFRVNNPSDLPFDVKDARFVLETAQGEPVEGTLFRQKDLDRFFDFYKASLGLRYNESLRIGERLKSRTVVDRTMAASFPVSAAAVAGRKRFVIRLDGVDAAMQSVIAEPSPANTR